MDPTLCANGCGFYGSAANKNLCSKCYNDHIKKIIIKISEAKILKKKEISVPNSHKPYLFGNFTNSTDDIESSKKKNEKKRCKSCNRKVGLTGFECRCGDVFCGRHRYPEEHECVVDFKEIGRQILAKQNPICRSDKLENRV